MPLEKDARLYRYGMLTRSLARFGHEVSWWTSSFSHTSRAQVLDRDEDVKHENVTLRILCGPGYKRSVSVARVVHQRHFAKKFYSLADKNETPDVIITPVPTLEVAKKAVLLGKRKRIPVIVDIRDEWPDEFVDLAPQALRPIARLLLLPYFRTMAYICKNATGIIGVSKSFQSYGLSFAKREAGKYDGVFPIGYSSDKSVDRSKIDEAISWWVSQGISRQSFVCCFFGTVGNFFNLEVVINAVKKLSNKFKIQVVICGNGSRLEYYKKLAADEESILFPGWVNEPKIMALMELAHVGLAPYAAETRMSLPNKPFEYFAGGLPVVSSIQGELKQLLEKHQCGRTYNPESADELVLILSELNSSPVLCREMGNRARNLLNEDFSIARIAASFNGYLLDVVEGFKNKYQINQ